MDIKRGQDGTEKPKENQEEPRGESFNKEERSVLANSTLHNSGVFFHMSI